MAILSMRSVESDHGTLLWILPELSFFAFFAVKIIAGRLLPERSFFTFNAVKIIAERSSIYVLCVHFRYS